MTHKQAVPLEIQAKDLRTLIARRHLVELRALRKAATAVPNRRTRRAARKVR